MERRRTRSWPALADTISLISLQLKADLDASGVPGAWSASSIDICANSYRFRLRAERILKWGSGAVSFWNAFQSLVTLRYARRRRPWSLRRVSTRLWQIIQGREACTSWLSKLAEASSGSFYIGDSNNEPGATLGMIRVDRGRQLGGVGEGRIRCASI